MKVSYEFLAHGQPIAVDRQHHRPFRRKDTRQSDNCCGLPLLIGNRDDDDRRPQLFPMIEDVLYCPRCITGAILNASYRGVGLARIKEDTEGLRQRRR